MKILIYIKVKIFRRSQFLIIIYEYDNLVTFILFIRVCNIFRYLYVEVIIKKPREERVRDKTNQNVFV